MPKRKLTKKSNETSDQQSLAIKPNDITSDNQLRICKNHLKTLKALRTKLIQNKQTTPKDEFQVKLWTYNNKIRELEQVVRKADSRLFTSQHQQSSTKIFFDLTQNDNATPDSPIFSVTTDVVDQTLEDFDSFISQPSPPSALSNSENISDQPTTQSKLDDTNDELNLSALDGIISETNDLEPTKTAPTNMFDDEDKSQWSPPSFPTLFANPIQQKAELPQNNTFLEDYLILNNPPKSP